MSLAAATGARAADCAGLAADRIADVTVTSAVEVAPAAAGAPVCEVKASVRTSPTTDIRIAVWMPVRGWNHRFLATGWAFYAGTMSPALLEGPAAKGYATATTDGGGTPGDPRFFLGSPGKVRDWGARAWHVTTVAAKALVRAYYGEGPAHSYWNGGGGAARQGLKEAQAYPADYDGIVVGGLANNTSGFAFAQVAEWQAVHPPGGVRTSVLPLLHRAALAACGGADGVVADPERCRFDPAVLACPAGALRDDCLAPQEVEAFRKLYAPVRNPKTGAVLFGGLAPGGELHWKGLIEDREPQSYALNFFRYIVFQDPAWDFRTLDYAKDPARAAAVDPSVNGNDPDLRPFLARGGRLLIWGGWSDDAIPPSADTGYYRAVVEAVGPSAARGVRLFMIPGMAHFPGRTGPDAYDFETQALMENWREHGAAPDRLAVTHWQDGAEVRAFDVCPYPILPAFDGKRCQTGLGKAR